MKTFLEKYPELLNLKEEEAMVYGYLSHAGELPARVISAETRIPYSQIHRILFRLQQEQLIVSRGETPKLFALRFTDPALLAADFSNMRTPSGRKEEVSAALI